MPDEPDPPRKFYGFKPREFERANEIGPSPTSTPAPSPVRPAVPSPSRQAVSVPTPPPPPAGIPPPPPASPLAFSPAPDPGITPASGDRITVQELNRLAATGQPLLSPRTPLVPQNEVHAMLKANLAVADAAGLNAVAPVRKYHRRKRDFVVLMIGGNLFIAVVYSIELLIGFQVQCLAAHLPFELYNLLRYAFSSPLVWALPFACMSFYSIAVSWILYGVLDDY